LLDRPSERLLVNWMIEEEEEEVEGKSQYVHSSERPSKVVNQAGGEMHRLSWIYKEGNELNVLTCNRVPQEAVSGIFDG
jgi:hypothetical protein